MDMKVAASVAKAYVMEMYADENYSQLGLEEIERDQADQRWLVTLSFSRPWSTPTSRAQEVLERLGSASGRRRAYKVVAVDDSGTVISMKNLMPTEAVE